MTLYQPDPSRKFLGRDNATCEDLAETLRKLAERSKSFDEAQDPRIARAILGLIVELEVRLKSYRTNTRKAVNRTKRAEVAIIRG